MRLPGQIEFLAPTGALGVKMCVRLCDIMLKSTLKEFLRVLKGPREPKRGP